MGKKRFEMFLGIACMLLFFPCIVFPQSPIWHSDQLIEDNAGLIGYHPQVAKSENNVVAVWSQSDGSHTRIYSNYSIDGGATWHADQLIEDNGLDVGLDAQVAMSGLNVVAVWSQLDGSGNLRIYSNYSTDGGATWHADQLIENNAGFSGGSPQVTMSGLNVVVVWDQQDATSRQRIYSNYSTDGGATWHADQLLEDNIGFDGWFPQVAVSGNNVVAVWYQPVATALRIYTNYSTDGGATWHADQLIEDNAGNSGITPEVAISGSNVVAVWVQLLGGSFRIHSNYSTDGGATWHPDQLIEDNAGQGGSLPQVTISGSNVVAVWYQSDGTTQRVYSNYSTDGGATWHSDQIIEDNAGNSGGFPQVAMSGNYVVAVWRQSDGSSYRIYSNHSTDGGATWHSDQMIEDNTGYWGEHPQVAISGNSIVAVWVQSNEGEYRIYSNYATFDNEPPTTAAIPTLNEWGTTILIILAGLGALYCIKKQRRAGRIS